MIIDARVRLPQELRPPIEGTVRQEFHLQYDAVLNVSSNRMKSLQELLQEMDDSGVEHAIMHAEYEYGNGVDDLNEAVANVVKQYP